MLILHVRTVHLLSQLIIMLVVVQILAENARKNTTGK